MGVTSLSTVEEIGKYGVRGTLRDDVDELPTIADEVAAGRPFRDGNSKVMGV